MKDISQKYPTVFMVIFGLTSMAWRAFEKQGLTKRRHSEEARDNAMCIAMRDMEELLSTALQIDMSNVRVMPSKDEGATWLDPK